MTDLDAMEAIRLAAPYCGDSGCHFGHKDKRGGQHTNGGCRCGNRSGPPGSLDFYARKMHLAFPKMIAELRAARKVVEAARKVLPMAQSGSPLHNAFVAYDAVLTGESAAAGKA